MNRVLEAIAKTILEVGARKARIMDGGVDADFGPLGSVRIEVKRVR